MTGDPSPAPTPSPTRAWRLRFSLRTFLIASTLLGAVLGPFAFEGARARRVASAVAALEKQPGVEVDWQVSDRWTSGVIRKLGSIEFQGWLGKAWTHDAVGVKMRDLTPMIDLAPITSLPELRRVSCSDLNLSPDGWRALVSLPKLSTLEIAIRDGADREPFADHLAAPSLRELTFTNHVSSRQPAPWRLVANLIAANPQLESLKLDRYFFLPPEIVDAIVGSGEDSRSPLGKSLRSLTIDARKLDRNAGDRLERLERLETLDFSWTELPEDWSQSVSDLKRLRSLRIKWVEASDLSRLAKLPALEFFAMPDSPLIVMGLGSSPPRYWPGDVRDMVDELRDFAAKTSVRELQVGESSIRSLDHRPLATALEVEAVGRSSSHGGAEFLGVSPTVVAGVVPQIESLYLVGEFNWRRDDGMVGFSSLHRICFDCRGDARELHSMLNCDAIRESPMLETVELLGATLLPFQCEPLESWAACPSLRTIRLRRVPDSTDDAPWRKMLADAGIAVEFLPSEPGETDDPPPQFPFR